MLLLLRCIFAAVACPRHATHSTHVLAHIRRPLAPNGPTRWARSTPATRCSSSEPSARPRASIDSAAQCSAKPSSGAASASSEDDAADDALALPLPMPPEEVPSEESSSTSRMRRFCFIAGLFFLLPLEVGRESDDADDAALVEPEPRPPPPLVEPEPRPPEDVPSDESSCTSVARFCLFGAASASRSTSVTCRRALCAGLPEGIGVCT